MRRWRYQDQGGVHEVTEDELMRDFYPHWCAEMRRVGREDLISEQHCIEDWTVVHWAEEVLDGTEGR